MSFRVIPATVPASSGDWLRAKGMPLSELPMLDERQRAEAKQLSVSEDEYRRFHVFLRNQVLERQRSQGEAFGNLIQEMIKPLGDRYTLATVARRGTPLGWRVVIRDQQKGTIEFQTHFDVVQSLVEGTASREEALEFQRNLLSELGHEMALSATG